MKFGTHAVDDSLYPPNYVASHQRKDSKLDTHSCERTESLLAIKQRQSLQTPFKIELELKARNILLHYILPRASTIREQPVSIKEETPIICQTACIY